ncbi:hypothetical protein SD70_03405 [Gordoniibacillus kamchatkensis]|uniref:ABC transmembrane type-1 domain-containing protein n=1 Tax=Gordoniibacillus kamchatkensis TaxID=1590651 RepID=A0ABR5ANJ2_9BACL|nr:hypothetical protein SD70_03405 [Paenibacillus sp. VKM B-2647]
MTITVFGRQAFAVAEEDSPLRRRFAASANITVQSLAEVVLSGMEEAFSIYWERWRVFGHSVLAVVINLLNPAVLSSAAILANFILSISHGGDDLIEIIRFRICHFNYLARI